MNSPAVHCRVRVRDCTSPKERPNPPKWVHDTFPDQRLFAWQTKYGAFSVSVSQLDTILKVHRKPATTLPKSEFFRKSSLRCLRGIRSSMPNDIYGSDSAVPSGLGLLFHYPTLERMGYSRSLPRERGFRSVVRFVPLQGPKMSKLQSQAGGLRYDVKTRTAEFYVARLFA
jgi:hypothetical protein